MRLELTIRELEGIVEVNVLREVSIAIVYFLLHLVIHNFHEFFVVLFLVKFIEDLISLIPLGLSLFDKLRVNEHLKIGLNLKVNKGIGPCVVVLLEIDQGKLLIW